MNNEIPRNMFKQKVDEIFSEKEIRFVGFVNMDGNLEEGKFREDILPFENDDEQQKI